jgi:hypothetical protein
MAWRGWLLAMAILVFTARGGLRADVTQVAEAELAKLPGHTGFAFCELTADGPRQLSGVRSDERFAVGSTFKLFILGTLAHEVNEHRRSLDDVALLQADLVGPPQSEMAEWPVDSPVTLHTLALKMIWISDNTATDHLLHLLGRKRIEKQMELMGDKNAAWNVPLLSTREMAMLRDKKQGTPGVSYNKLDEAGKRHFLDEHFQGVPDYEALDFDTAAYNVAEWYATPLDMAHALAWLRVNAAAGKPAHPLLAVLTVDPKLEYDKQKWPYVGFKGGSEDQLLAGNWLLKNQNGKWYTINLFYNNPDGTADPEKLIGALQAIFKEIEASLEQ